MLKDLLGIREHRQRKAEVELIIANRKVEEEVAKARKLWLDRESYKKYSIKEIKGLTDSIFLGMIKAKKILSIKEDIANIIKRLEEISLKYQEQNKIYMDSRVFAKEKLKIYNSIRANKEKIAELLIRLDKEKIEKEEYLEEIEADEISTSRYHLYKNI